MLEATTKLKYITRVSWDFYTMIGTLWCAVLVTIADRELFLLGTCDALGSLIADPKKEFDPKRLR